jgi:hypothetical protein
MTYDSFLELTDQQLIDLKITLGARKRLLSNIEKLKTRGQRLKRLIDVS